MIKVLESNLLEDKFIDLNFVSNISIKDKLLFKKNNIYYFGNYDKKNINIIRKKLLKNKKRIINAIENNIKIIVVGNSCNLFNNVFKNNKSLNLFISIDNVKIKNNNIKEKNNYKLITINNINNTIYYPNFRYKNFIFIRNEKNIKKVIT